MKLIISGSAGTGKTTLAKRISEHTGVAYIPDYVDVVLSEKRMKSPREMDDQLAVLIRKEAFERKIEHERREKIFVSDKGVVDYFAYWLIWTSNHASLENNKEFYSKVVEHTRLNKEKPVILQFGKYRISDNDIRSVDYFHQLRIHALIKGLYQELRVNFIEYNYLFNKPIEKVLIELGV